MRLNVANEITVANGGWGNDGHCRRRRGARTPLGPALRSPKNLPRPEHIDHVDVVVLVLALDVLPYVRLHLAHVLAVRALESRLLAALVAQVAGQVPLPREHAAAIGVRAGELAGLREPVGPPVAAPLFAP